MPPRLLFLAAAALCATACTEPQQPGTWPPVNRPANTPAAGARAPDVLDESRNWSETPSSGPRTYNSDNRPTVSRSGLNSDPDNPNGAPGPTTRIGM